MSHRIELKNNLVIVQLATSSGKTFRLIEESADPTKPGELLDESTSAEEILHAAERFQEGEN